MKYVLLAGRFSRAERAKRRARINLDDAGLTEKTRSRYYVALRKLIPYFERVESPQQLDVWMSGWVRRMWKDGEPSLTVGDGLSSLSFFQPWTKRLVPHAWRLFATWRKIEIPNRAPPLTKPIVYSLSAYEWQMGNYEMSCLLLLGFHCLLRTGELLKLQCSDFNLGARSGIVALKDTKSGRRNSVNEMVSITDPTTLEVVRCFADMRRTARSLHWTIWSGSSAQFRVRFNQLMKLFHLEHLLFRPYSLRRGGATLTFQQSKSMEATLLRGRWESSRVARLYINDALSHLPSINMSEKSRRMLLKFNFATLQ